ncbi:MAG: hypothetical protein ACYTXI_32725 [Nostoc sp.]
MSTARFLSEELEKNRRIFQRGEFIGGFCRDYVVVLYYFLMAVASASAFHFWLSKTFRQIWRTVRQKKMDYRD